ncbi:MAG TPA: 3-hydroxyacyl-ACP dehydratase FabZ family protein [Candidatus Limiplasma sp.]|nr:3-hydroxyacyl-ACP dehydratase FabZ family protein [Candidatus Limiplasma sp.]
MNREEIKELIPHREPMLLVDEINLDGEFARATYTVRGDEWFLQGHFPGNPVVPGVVLCEIIAQGAALLLKDDLIGKVPFFAGMNKVKFRQPARPGDRLDVTAKIIRHNGPFVMLKGEAYVGDKKAVEGEYTIALIDKENAVGETAG